MRNLTLEERERLAYITNSADHPLILLALDADTEKQEEISSLTEENDRLDKLLAQANDDWEKDVKTLDDELEEAKGTITELRAKLEAQPKARKPRAKKLKPEELIADLL
jgi:hypothetical protein